MATIRASCPNCGDAELTSNDVKVFYDDPEHSAGHYTFFHKDCGREIIKAANQRTLDLLAASGSLVISLTLASDEQFDPARTITEPMTHNEINDFVNALTNHDDPLPGDPRLDK